MASEKIEKITDYLAKQLSSDNYEVFLDKNKTPYLSFRDDNGALQHWPLDSRIVETHIIVLARAQLSLTLTKKEALKCIEWLEIEALITNNVYETATRVGYDGGAYYLDLCDPLWQTIKITAVGWSIINICPIKFIRNDSLEALPKPISPGDFDQLWQLVNIDEKDRILVTAWLLECLRTNTDSPILEITGNRGSGKSSTTRLIRDVIDPNRASLRQSPKSIDDLFISAQKSGVLVFENVSDLSKAMQDAMCQLVTGSGFAKRKLFSDADEVVLQVQKPLILNGIGKLITRSDLLERSIGCFLKNISPEQRKMGSVIQLQFKNKHGDILGGLLTLFTQVLKQLPSTVLNKAPRLADFGQLGQALCNVLNEPRTFYDLLLANQETGAWEAIQDNPIVLSVIQYVQKVRRYCGTYQELLEKLHYLYDLPRQTTPKKLSTEINNWSSSIQELGIRVDLSLPRTNQGRRIILEVIDSDVHNLHTLSKINENATDSAVEEDPFFKTKINKR